MTCVARVRATLKGMKGVSDVQVDFRNKVATVQLENGRLSRDAVTAILKEQGYGVTSFKEEALPSGFRPYRVAISGMT